MGMNTVLVTGSSRGIGFAIAKAFYLRGDRVVLNCRKDALQLEKAVKELGIDPPIEVCHANSNHPPKRGDCDTSGAERINWCRNSKRVMGVRADVSNYEECAALFSKAEEAFGHIDVLVNNAGAAHFGLFAEMSPDEIQGIFAANLLSAVNASHLAIPNMVRKKSGCIINITSIWGITGASCEAVYSAAKAGVNGMTKALAKELAPSNIRVNAIACGAFNTRMNSGLSQDEKNAFAEEIPLGRFGEPSEAGELAVFLASESAGYLTGQIIALDGGFT
ncbi:MAG: SDR family oxidoreductase [Defluviitaleaceae bacterium]|nr:SDR family oxidoreductase [Defluviitaleaceae bacterium]